MKAISIKQPWASLIMAGHKEVEVRTWKTDYRGALIIHTGMRGDGEAVDKFWGKDRSLIEKTDLPTGCILGKIELVDVVEIHPPNWNDWKCYHRVSGPWPGHPLFAWWLAKPKKLSHPIPYKGQQGLFYIPDGFF